VKLNKGDVVNIELKPSLLREWEFVRETPKCLVFDKTRGGVHKYRGEVYVPKKANP
jgi:hypothetical protein